MKSLKRILVGAACVAAVVTLSTTAAFAGTIRPTPNRGDSQAPVTVASFGPTVIRNAVTGKCVDIPGFGLGTVDGPVNQFTCNATTLDNQLFYFDDGGIGDGFYNIWNAKDGLCLDVPFYGSVPPGTPVSEYPCDFTFNDNQLFYLSLRPDGHYWIVNWWSSLCLDVAGFATGGNDARLTLYTCSDSDDHHWII
jgi:hypothetical protein